MTTQWIADVPNSTTSLFGVADSGINNPIAIDAEWRVHIAFVSTVASGGANTLTYAIGTPDGPLQIFGHQPFVMLRQYQWHFFPVVPPSEWGILSLFDLALDSQGRAHLCFSGGRDGRPCIGTRSEIRGMGRNEPSIRHQRRSTFLFRLRARDDDREGRLRSHRLFRCHRSSLRDPSARFGSLCDDAS